MIKYIWGVNDEKIIKILIVFFFLLLLFVIPDVEANQSEIDFSFKYDSINLELGEDYQLTIITNNLDLKYCFIILKFDPTKINFTGYELNKNFDAFTYTDDEVEGRFSIHFDRTDLVNDDNSLNADELIKYNFICTGLSETTIELEFFKYGYDADYMVEKEMKYTFNVVDNDNYNDFIYSVKLIDSTNILSQFSQIKLAISEASKFKNGVVGIKEAKDSMSKLEDCMENYNHLVEKIDYVSTNADLVLKRVGGK